MSLLEVQDVSRRENNNTVLQPISFRLETSSRLAILGATGSGKSTLLKLIAGLLQPTSGTIYFEDKKVLGPEEQLLPGHSSIAYLSQDFELRNNYYVHELLDMASKIEPTEAATIFNICRIDHLLKRRSNQLSGGERQRISLAATLIKKPKLLLLDEPFSNADQIHKAMLKNILQKVNEQLSTAIIMVSHDPLDILPWAEHLLVLKEGKLVQTGTPHAVYHNPKDEYVAGLTGYYNMFSPTELRMLGIKPISNTSAMIIRPEQLKLDKKGEGIRAVVSKQMFMGSYHIMAVALQDREVQVMSLNNNFCVGEQVFITATIEKHNN
jgi:iron(III) transport system ATP-binding protein